MLFNFVFFVYALGYLPYLFLTGRWYKGYGCRLGFFPFRLKACLYAVSSVWIHAVSVGEIMAVTGLVSKIKSRWPSYTIVVTTTTKTGYELAQSKLKDKAIVIPSPLDFSWVASSFVRLINPKIYLAAETEIWPNLFHCLYRRKIPIVITNGRVSDVSYGRYKAIRVLLRKTIEKVSFFCMQSDTDAARIIELGADKDKILTVGNIKFDELPSHQEILVQLPILKDRPVWVAGSTHPGEEEIVLRVFAKHRDSWGLVIAPRHVDRSEQIVGLVQSRGFKAVRFSQLSPSQDTKDTVIVVDTIGHLCALYAQASLVFVGKSLCVGGGHNIIEPAFYAKPVIIGPYMQNFRDVTALFKTQGAIVQVKDELEFEGQVARLIGDEHLRTQLGQKAYAVVKANQGSTERTLKILEKWL